MYVRNHNGQVPVYSIEPDEATGNKNFKVYNYEGDFPNRSELLVPHRKNHYLLVFIRRAGSRQWVDMEPYILKDNTVYFTTPAQVIVKEEIKQLWSTGIAFTSEFLSLQENTSLNKLPLIQNLHSGFELLLTKADAAFVEDMLATIKIEYGHPGEWQQRMLAACLTVLLTYLSRIYTEQYKDAGTSTDTIQLTAFKSKINECFRELHQVSDYAARLHISAKHLSEVVKAQSGKPAIKHIHERLVMEARRLLFHTDHSLKEIAFDLGFADASYFNRFFKRETGVTPSGYRDSVRKIYR